MENRASEVRRASFGTNVGVFLAPGISVYLLLSLFYVGIGSYHDVRYWDSLQGAAPFPASARLAKETQELERAPIPISKSMGLLAKSGREAFPAIRPESAARAPLPGWVHHPDFKRAVQGVEEWRKTHETSDVEARPRARERRADSSRLRGQEVP